MNEPKIIFLNPSDISIPENYIPVKHKKYTCDAIRITGIFVPIVVYEEGGKYYLKDGYERLNCAKMLGMQTIPAIVVSRNEPLISFTLNFVRGSYCGIQILMYVYDFLQRYSIDVVEKILGRSAETVRKYARIVSYILSLNLGKEAFDEMQRRCVPLKKIIYCAEHEREKEGFMSCIRGEYRPKKGVTSEAVRKAVELEKNAELKNAVELVETYGVDKVSKLFEILGILKDTVCPKLGEIRACLESEVFNTLSMICKE